jgi:DNA repair protein RecO (recombination protein O)
METVYKDEAIVLNRKFVGEKDLTITVYTKKSGKESIYIQNGQYLKNMPYSILSPFCWFKAVLIKIKDKLIISEIDSYKQIGYYISQDIEKFEAGFNIINFTYKLAPHQDERIFILLKKSLYFLTISKLPKLLEILFLLKITYLNGELDLKRLNLNNKEFDFLKGLMEKSIKEASQIEIENVEFLESLRSKLIRELVRE